ncbi:hypothetical protein [Aeromonas hydrophila]|uniref:hypothetical protein n=1 Tax=Aeromonas hydrophila TaxID=644 RepID=UPI0035B6E209
MMEALKVMTYFKVSLSTHNWDRAFLLPARRHPALFALLHAKLASQITRFHKRIAPKFITLPAIFSTRSAVAVWKY